MVNTEMNSQSLYKLWNSICTGTAKDFVRITDPWSLLFLMVLMTVTEGTYKTGAVK